MCSSLPRNLTLFGRFRSVLSSVPKKAYCDSKDCKQVPNKSTKSGEDVLGAIATKYQIFRNEDSSTILDVNEERFKYAQFLETQEEFDVYAGLNLNRKLFVTFNLTLSQYINQQHKKMSNIFF